MPFMPAEALGHAHFKSGLPPLHCPHLQSCLVQEFPKIYPPRGYGIPLSVVCIERSLSKLHVQYKDSRPTFDRNPSAGVCLQNISRDIWLPYYQKVHAFIDHLEFPMLFNAVVTLCFMIFEIYSYRNLLFVGQLTGYTISRLKTLCTYKNIIKKCLDVSLGQNIILGTIKLKS